MTRLEKLKESLTKKETLFNSKLEDHMNDVRGAQGEPMAGHRGGERVLRRWEKQNSALRTLDESIKKTKAAIEREENKIAGVQIANETLPSIFLKLVEDGLITQWRKFPNTFFVVGVEKGRIGWDDKKKIAFHRYFRQIECAEQREKFKSVWAIVFKELNEGKV